MRLFVAAAMVVVTFVVVVLLISRLFPYGAGWAGVCVAVACLYASAFGAWAVLGNKPDKNTPAMQGEIVERHLLRDNLLSISQSQWPAISRTTGLLDSEVRALLWATLRKRSGFSAGTGVFGRSLQPYSLCLRGQQFPPFPKWKRCLCCLWGRWPISSCLLPLLHWTGSSVGSRGDMERRSC